jgi:hypothetical protein
MLTNYLLILILIIFYLYLFNFSIYPISLAFPVFTIFVGLLFLENNLSVKIYFFLALELLIIGYYLGVKKIKKKYKKLFIPYNIRPVIRTNNPSVEYYSFWILSIMYTCLFIYHMVKMGIPIIRNTEIDRFNFIGSGLFGIPGRIYLYGLPFLFIFTFVYKEAVINSHKHFKYLFSFIFLVFVISRILGGFKSGLINIVALIILAKITLYGPINFFNIIKEYFIFIIVSICYALWMSTKFSSILNIYSSLGKYFFERVFIIPALPSVFIFSNNMFNGYFLYFLNDIKYYFGRYFNLFKPDNFPTVKIISAYIYNTPLTETSFLVPVTITSVSELYLNFGFIVSLILILFIGYIFGRIFFISRIKNNYLQIAMLIVIQDAFIEFITKGNLFYIIFNYSLMIALTFLLYMTLKLLIKLSVFYIKYYGFPNVLMGKQVR